MILYVLVKLVVENLYRPGFSIAVVITILIVLGAIAVHRSSVEKDDDREDR